MRYEVGLANKKWMPCKYGKSVDQKIYGETKRKIRLVRIWNRSSGEQGLYKGRGYDK